MSALSTRSCCNALPRTGHVARARAKRERFSAARPKSASAASSQPSHSPEAISLRSHEEERPASSAPRQPVFATWMPRVSSAVASSVAALLLAGPAGALGGVEIALGKFEARQVECPAGQRTMTMGRPACVEVDATATNPKDQTFFNVDVFGRVLDAGGDNALDRDEASDAGRVTNIKRVPPGESRVRFNFIVSQRQFDKGDLQFKFFKAKAYPGGAYTGISPLIDTEDCDPFADPDPFAEASDACQAAVIP